MDTLNVWRSLWRNRWLVLPVILLTTLAGSWVLYIRPPTYQVQSSVLLVPPPPAPSQADIDKDPRLRNLNSDNPFGRSYDPTILIALASIAITSDSSRAAIKAAGGDERFTVAQSNRYGFSSPFADITSVGPSAKEAIASNTLVIKAFQRELINLQLAEKPRVSDRYLITARIAGEPSSARVQVTDIGRLLLGVAGLGIAGLFCAVSLGDSVREIRRQERSKTRTTATRGGGAPPIPSPFPGDPGPSPLQSPRRGYAESAEFFGSDLPRTRMRP